MLYAVKGNKEKTIDESMIESCVQQGYKIVNECGVVLRETIPTDMASLKLAYKNHEETIKDLKATNSALKTTIATLEAQLKEATEQLAKAKTSASDMSTSKSKAKAKDKE